MTNDQLEALGAILLEAFPWDEDDISCYEVCEAIALYINFYLSCKGMYELISITRIDLLTRVGEYILCYLGECSKAIPWFDEALEVLDKMTPNRSITEKKVVTHDLIARTCIIT
jgi:hypothetical protein